MSSWMGEPPVSPSYEPTPNDKTWGTLAHLSCFLSIWIGVSFVGPLVVWLIYKDKSQFIEDQAKESLNFQLAVLIAALVCTITCIGIPIAIVIAIASIIYPIIAAMAAN